MPLNPLTLTFTGKNQDVEQRYREFHFANSLFRTRLGLVAGTLLYGVFAILDHLTVPQKQYLFWAIRFLIVIPGGIVVLLFSFHPLYNKYHQPILFSVFLTGGLGTTAMVFITPPPVVSFYFVGIILILINLNTIIGLRFPWALACSIGLLVIYELTVISIHIPPRRLLYDNFFMISAVGLCVAASYVLEKSSRLRFIAIQELKQERQIITAMNSHLDQAVQERTKALSLSNARLMEEMQHREQVQAQALLLERELGQKKKTEALGTLAGGIAHDFNNILAAIIGYTEMAMDEPDTALQQDNQEQVLTAALRARDLTRQILDYSRQEGHELDRLLLSHVVLEALDLLRATLPQGVELTSPLTSEHRVLGNPTQIHRVVMNLCTNALHAILPNSGTIAVTLRSIDVPSSSNEPHTQGLLPGPHVELLVEDTGCGIATQNIEKIFDPFFTTREVGKGTGMGLSVVQGIVKQHGGAITVESVPGEGTSFTVTLPALL